MRKYFNFGLTALSLMAVLAYAWNQIQNLSFGLGDLTIVTLVGTCVGYRISEYFANKTIDTLLEITKLDLSKEDENV